MENLSLITLMSKDPSFSERLAKKTLEVRKDKKTLLTNAGEYNKKFQKEIDEGTEKRRLLLQDGHRRGLSELETFQEYNKFVPTKYTPLLNYLYFLLREGNDPDWLSFKREMEAEYGGVHHDYDLSIEELEDKYCREVHPEEKYENVREPEEMDKFIYGNMTHDMFKKIKKLKALSKSSNSNESSMAYQLCLKLCRQYGLEYEKIPCVIE